MNPAFIPILDTKISELNDCPEHQLQRVFSIVRRLEEHLQGIELQPGQLKHLVDELLFYTLVEAVPIPLSGNMKFTRAVRYEEGSGIGYERVSRLSYISPNSGVRRRAGRMNKEGESVYYASKDIGPNSMGAVLSEMQARPGEIFNVLFSETVHPQEQAEQSDDVLRITPVGVFDYYRRGLPDPFGLHQEYRSSYEYLVAKTRPAGMLAMQLADAFLSYILKREGTERLYSVTSLISTQFSSYPTIDGMLYLSTQFDGCPNVALKTTTVDRKLKHLRAESIRVLERYGFGIFTTEIIGIGHIDGGNVIWQGDHRGSKRSSVERPL
jgi:hypothetical protein